MVEMIRIKDFSINHKGIAVKDRPKMTELLAEIKKLMLEYGKLKEREQRKQFSEYIFAIRNNSNEAHSRDLGLL